MSDKNESAPEIEETAAPVEVKKVPKPLTSLDQIAKIVKRKDVTYASHYMIPSLKREVPFNEINTSQQKRLVKSVIDSPVYNTEFIYTLRDILKENCQDDDLNVDNLTIIDKLIIALGLRVKSIGNNADIEIETKTGEKVNVSLDISKVIDLAYKTVKSIGPKTVEDEYFIVECSVPTIGDEFRLEKELRPNVTDIEIENIKELRNTIGDAFISELVKYVSNVSVKTDDGIVPVEWENFNFASRIKVVESFKSSLLKQVLDYVNTVRDEINKIELVKFDFGGETYERRLSIDGSFFTIS